MSFDTLAPHYRWLERVCAGEKLQRCRVAFLDEVQNAGKILILGEGNGRFLAECQRKILEAEIVSVDSSARMLELAHERIQHSGLSLDHIQFIHADALNWKPAASQQNFDLIVTHFFLDCFRADQIAALIKKLSNISARNCNWLIADFQIPASGFNRVRSRLIVWALYLFFRAVTGLPARELAEPDEFLQRNGFALRERRVSDWRLLRSDWWQRE